MTVGFLGVGTISTAVVRGLRLQTPDLEIHLSPRSEAASRTLAQNPGVTRHLSNASVVAISDIVFLTMLPPNLDEALSDCTFRPGQIVVSCIGGTPLADVEALVAPATACRVVPLPAIARRQGPLVLYKAPAAVRSLLQGLGDIIEAEDETSYQAYVRCGAFMSTYFRLQQALIAEMAHNGVPGIGATNYVRSLLRSLAETSIETDRPAIPDLVLCHETPGGLNERVRTYLEQHGWFDQVHTASESIAHLRRSDLTKTSE